MSHVVIAFAIVLMIVFSVLCYACCIASGRCSREEEKLERYENGDSGNV